MIKSLYCLLPWLITSNAIVTFWHHQPYFTIISLFCLFVNLIYALEKTRNE